MTEKISPLSIIQQLKTEPIQLVIWHKVKEYDIYYEIWYQTQQPLFEMNLVISVWDGRGNETGHEIVDEPTLLTRLNEILSEGQIQSIAFSPYTP
ncbi:MAG: hypothetical protein IAF02_16700 [Anaerolineae bacterium]|nr:hypothetical protein [Anaerolineae bacterium]